MNNGGKNGGSTALSISVQFTVLPLHEEWTMCQMPVREEWQTLCRLLAVHIPAQSMYEQA